MLKHLFIALAIFANFSGLSQNVEGWIFDGEYDNEKIPLVGANVYWIHQNTGTTTDQNGYFSLKKNEETNTLVVSFVGYSNDTLKITGSKTVQHKLYPGQKLTEVTIEERVKPTAISKINPRLAQTISSKELNRFACCNLSESFETNASVDVSYSDAVSGVKQIRLLGLDGRYSQLMLENIPILRGAETAFGLDYIPGTWMERIHVSKGSSAVKNGYESVTGQINIQYKEPMGDEKLHFYTYANQDGKIEGNLGYAYEISEHWATSVLAHAGTHVRKMDMNDDGFLDKPLTDISSFMNRWQYTGKQVEGKFGLSFLSESREGGQKDFDHSKTRNEQSAYGIGIDVRKVHGFSKVGFLLERSQTSIGTIASFNYFDRNSFYGNRNFNTEQLNLYTNLIFQTYLFNTSHSYNTGVSFTYDRNNTLFQDSTFNINNTVPGLFLEYNYKPTVRTTIMAGMRYDYSSIHGGFYTPRIHVKHDLIEYLTFRGSVGKGHRSAYAISENSNLLASARTFVFEEEIDQEEAWNYGSSLVTDFPLFGRDMTFSVEYFFTQFLNKMVVDLDQDDQAVHFYNLDGKAYARSFQTEIMIEPFERFDLTAAFRLTDVQTQYAGGMKQEPYIQNYKGLISAGYSTNMNKWKFDATVQFHGLSRLPGSYEENAEQYDIDSPKPFINVIAQVTKNYRFWSFYIGVENLTDFTQERAIVDVQNPFGNDFDASTVWGPLYGRMFYAGIKYILIK
ncbi:outer membrane receptor FepA [Salinivirga cyanobacteriivorans]|uniref:Outer membrane receptor FepA n=1 Tax=Salinivirga cyanobacteriivorans TaxID=1307839 RepID=A0A0S2I0K4_9BACT|nr:TonB-dependent receptor [Salinivirga cyanobacteriivorans]ALO15532.1 outer membrane receptor FepA [Salinivirga cyanobacteriivorans]